jgi:hypothetical protein
MSKDDIIILILTAVVVGILIYGLFADDLSRP